MLLIYFFGKSKSKIILKDGKEIFDKFMIILKII